MPDPARVVTGGVDTHSELHVAAVIDGVGRVLGTETFEASARGYGRLLAWMRSFGDLDKVGVEGTGSYGAGLDRYLSAHGVEVVEVVRPNRQKRRQRGKSDPVDAEEAARAALNGEACGSSKSKTGTVESLRALRVARRGALKARTQAANSITALVISAPAELRARLQGLPTEKRVELAARFRPGDATDPLEATKTALRSIARRYHELDTEIADLDEMIESLVVDAAPAEMLTKQGVGPRVATALLVTAGDNPQRMRSDASFAALCGASPVDASSGKQVRHRLNRGGDREANSALWRIVQTRMRFDPETKAYVQRRTNEGKTTAEIVRCLKRYVAREIYKTLVASRKTSGAIAEKPLRAA
ncbi:MAG: IS110 family RNA-guided transposase [Acidimicrobiales bacterium]